MRSVEPLMEAPAMWIGGLSISSSKVNPALADDSLSLTVRVSDLDGEKCIPERLVCLPWEVKSFNPDRSYNPKTSISELRNTTLGVKAKTLVSSLGLSEDIPAQSGFVGFCGTFPVTRSRTFEFM